MARPRNSPAGRPSESLLDDDEYDEMVAEDRAKRARERRWCPSCAMTGWHRPGCPNEEEDDGE
jgi:hypothetical protein